MVQSVLQMDGELLCSSSIDALDYQPVADLKKYPRGKVELPQDPHDGWAAKVSNPFHAYALKISG